MQMKTIKKIFFRALYIFVFSWFPSSFLPIIGKPCMKLRTICVRGYATYVGKNVNIQRKASISSLLSIGENSGIGANSEISGPTTIGKYVNMGPECIIFTTNHRHDRTDIVMQKQGYTTPQEVVIGDDVWIGRNVTILPGCKIIGTGCVIGACSVVTKDIPDYEVWAGNPARFIKRRK